MTFEYMFRMLGMQGYACDECMDTMNVIDAHEHVWMNM